MTWRVSVAGPAEASAVAALLHAFNDEFATPVPDVDALATRFSRLLWRDDVCVLLCWPEMDADAFEASHPVGFAFATVRPSAYCDAGTAMLEELYVVPGERSAGAGSALLEKLQERTSGRGVDELQVNVDSVDADARRFYERHGFSNLEGVGEDGEPSQLLLYVRCR